MRFLFSINPNHTTVGPSRWNVAIWRRRCSGVEWKLTKCLIYDIQFKGSSLSNLGTSNFMDFRNGKESAKTGCESGRGVTCGVVKMPEKELVPDRLPVFDRWSSSCCRNESSLELFCSWYLWNCWMTDWKANKFSSDYFWIAFIVSKCSAKARNTSDCWVWRASVWAWSPRTTSLSSAFFIIVKALNDKHKLVYLEKFCCIIRASMCSKEKNREGRKRNKERKLDYFLA